MYMAPAATTERKMEEAKVIIAMQNMQAADKIRYALQRGGFTVVETCKSCSEALRNVRTLAPDILLINFDMPDMTGLEAATIIGEENLCSVVLFVNTEQKDLCAELTEEYDITLFLKPVNLQGLIPIIDAVIKGRRRTEKLGRELTKLKKGFDDRKLVERAKGILMDRKGISEAEAYRRIQKMSMDSRVAMRDIALKIVELANNNL